MSDRRGFTLVELLVSLAILSVALAVLLAAISSSLDRSRLGRDEALAQSLVQSLLARAGTEGPLRGGEGVYAGGYRWRLAVTPYGGGDDAAARHMSAFLVRATVTWDGRTKSLSALRLVPLPPKAPA
ncbi:MAG: prepilin-type N-terminal cleavage/methylation domain-containing protein [Rhizomicrobium sp.]